MTPALDLTETGPHMTVQDTGRSGTLSFGLSRGGAADRHALAEGAALLGQGTEHAALELAGMGGAVTARGDLVVALTGAVMRAEIDGAPAAWNACHALRDGQTLRIGPATRGNYGYVSVGGGLLSPTLLGSRSMNPVAGVGAPLEPGTRLAVGGAGMSRAGLGLAPLDRFGGGALRVLRGPQTGLFTAGMLKRFEETTFRRDPRSNRQAARLAQDGAGFIAEGGLSVLSDIIVPGDIQITGDGTPFVLMPDCQTAGGYPRLGTVLPCDLPRVAQAGPGDTLRFAFVDRETALGAQRAAEAACGALTRSVAPIVRDPSGIADLLSYQLVDGVTAGDDLS
ncbi:urea amidolyase [Meridianimarinicoccus roseus]|uniref:Urea amidolyase n=1 Tax=Meridianimarinicoccus roseus TaxID=2072018 RepID=A0A2V2LJ25_9RHOB|nr:biotin-dependent carboxyltransferase family protein [Meridianimarinicoccus roseus]PWR03196.1 urea amidolyase [Meridianimarinicoccus roseus]